MSAWIVSDNHINALVDVGLRGPAGCREWYHVVYGIGALTSGRANEVGSDLLKENYRSVNYRYRENDEAPAFTFDPNQRRISTVEALKAIHCYEYQACEHPEWEQSDAHKFCTKLRHSLEHYLPGYEEAPWGIR